jgi:hypothetical protein
MYGDYTSSRGVAAGDIYESEVAQQEAEYGKVKAVQTNAQQTRNLAITLGHIDAVRAAAHTDPTSPTGAAVRGETEMIGTEKKDIAVENFLQQARMDEAKAAYLRTASSNALLSGDISMAGDLFSGLSSVFGGGGGGGGGGAGMGPGQSISGGSTPFFSPFGGT